MKRERIFGLLVAGGVFLLPGVCAALSDDHPYKSIVVRNSFALTTPPPPAPVNTTPPPANVKLTGISTLFGDKRALLMVQDSSGPGKPDQSVILREGQRDGQIEVLEIDEKLGSVKLKNAGVPAVLTFDANGVKLPALPVAAAGQPPNVIPAPPRGGGQNPIMPDTGQLQPRGGGQGPTMTPVGQPQPHSGLRQIPTRTLRSPQSAAPVGTAAGATANSITPPPPTPSLSADDQRILLETAAELSRDKNIPFPPIPGE